MSDGELAWLVFAGLYLLESCHGSAPGESCLLKGPGGWRLDFGRLVFKHVLPYGGFLRFPAAGGRLDEAAVDQALRRHERAAALPRRLGGAFCLLSLAGFPLLAALYPHPLLLLALAGACLACWWGAAAALFFSLRALAPGERGRRWLQLAHALIAPGFAMRAADALAELGAAGLHPMAVARRKLPPADFQSQARLLSLELAHLGKAPERLPSSMTGPDKDAWESWLRELGLDPAALLAPPAKEDGQVGAYCPRCMAQYRQMEGTCADCRLELKAY